MTLDDRFARLREREAPAVKAQRYAEMFVRGAPSRGAPAPAEPDGETETHTEYRAVGGCPNGGQGEGYRGDSLRAARISADQLARHDYTGVRVETRTVTTTRTTTAWEEQR